MTETTGDSTDDELSLEPTSGAEDVVGFAVMRAGQRIGTVAIIPETRGPDRGKDGRLRWKIAEETNAFSASKALGLAMTHAHETLGLERLEARVPDDDPRDARIASIAGMRREGVARQGDGTTKVIFARLATDPPALSKTGFIAILNAGLPRKRIISQGIIRDESGRFLLCELTYKNEWDLPGGVIEVNEAPARGLVREISEELGVTFTVDSLVTVNWLPAWREWDDASNFVFDLGTVDSSIVGDMSLQHTEIVAVHWCTLDEIRERATGATVELIEAMSAGQLPPYREAPLQPE